MQAITTTCQLHGWSMPSMLQSVICEVLCAKVVGATSIVTTFSLLPLQLLQSQTCTNRTTSQCRSVASIWSSRCRHISLQQQQLAAVMPPDEHLRCQHLRWADLYVMTTWRLQCQQVRRRRWRRVCVWITASCGNGSPRSALKWSSPNLAGMYHALEIRAFPRQAISMRIHCLA